MSTLTANELKTKGVSVIEKSLQNEEEIIITVRGKDKFIIMDLDRYNFLRECELEAALTESLKDLENSDYVVESVDDHIRRIKNEL